MRVVLFLIGTFINKLASGEPREEVTSAVIDETEFHEGRIILFAAWLCISAHCFETHKSLDYTLALRGACFAAGSPNLKYSQYTIVHSCWKMGTL